MKRRFALSGSTSERLHIDMAPLIDLVFLLLIFYIVTTSFVREAGITVERPNSQRSVAMAGSVLQVAITAGGTVMVAGHIIGADDSTAIAEAMGRSGLRRIAVVADGNAPVALLMRVMDACHGAGAESVAVAAELPR